MNKQEFTNAVAEKAGVEVKKSDIETIIASVFETIVDATKRGERCQINKFGTFTEKTRPARKARNPRTGETVDVPAQTKLVFKASKKSE